MIILQEIKLLLEQNSINNLLSNTSKKLIDDNYLSSRSIMKDEKLSKEYSSKFKNLTLEIYIVQDSSINAFTIPGVDNYDNFLKNPNYYAFTGLVNLYNRPISAKLNQNKIIVNRKINIICFIHSGLISKLNSEQIFSVILHEIGHWMYPKKGIFAESILKLHDLFLSRPFTKIDIPEFFIGNNDNILFPVVRSFAILSIIMSNFFSRNSEYFSDDFSKKMGYGKYLYESLSLMRFNKVLKEKDLNNISFKMKIYFKYIVDMITSYFTGNIPSHPTTISRLSNLISESNFSNIGINMFHAILYPIDNFLSTNVLRVCPWIRL